MVRLNIEDPEPKPLLPVSPLSEPARSSSPHQSEHEEEGGPEESYRRTLREALARAAL